MNKVLAKVFLGRHGNYLLLLFIVFVFVGWLIFFIESLLSNNIGSYQLRHFENNFQDDDDVYVEKHFDDEKVNDEEPPIDDAKWQNVAGTGSKFYVYSAYLDDRQHGPIVRILAVTTTRTHSDIYCRLNYVQRTVDVIAHVQIIKENWNLEYSAAFVLCPLQQNLTDHHPNSVSVVADYEQTVTNRLLIHNSRIPSMVNNGNDDNRKEIVACIKPLHFHYGDAVRLVEFLELNRILGVNHFTFYNHTVGPEVDCILRRYAQSGIVTVLPWQLDIQSQVEIRTEAMFAALNDCLYRNMYNYRFVMVIDLDEIIMPRMHPTLSNLLKFLDSKHSARNSASFSFQNVFFYLQWPDDQQMISRPYASNNNVNNDKINNNNTSIGGNIWRVQRALTTLKKTRRMFRPHPHRQRSKYICRAEYVVEIGNHFVWQFIKPYAGLNVNPTYALLHHYRVCEFGGNDCVNANFTTDRTAHRYINELTTKFVSKWIELKSVCHLTDIL